MKLITYTLIFLIKIYQLLISPLFPNSCRFNPTCSNYCIDALKKNGVFKGLYNSFIRILKCNPWFDSIETNASKKHEEIK